MRTLLQTAARGFGGARSFTADCLLEASCSTKKNAGLLMCELCWSDWHAAQPHVAPECVCTRFPCYHFWLHSCYHDSFLERQWSEDRQGKSRRRAVIISDVWHLSRDSELLELIHSTWFSQRSIANGMARARFLGTSKTGAGTTQESLSLID